MSATRVIASLLVAVAVAACASDSGTTIEEDAAPTSQPGLAAMLEDRLAVEAELRERLDELEAAVGDDIGVERRLDELEQALSQLDARTIAEQTERIELETRLDEAERDLRASVADVRDALERLRGQLQDLEIRYQVLQERIDRLQS